MPERTLVIGNRRYSSWSLRAWIGLASVGVAFREQRIALHVGDYKADILRHSPAGKVPVLIDGELAVHESIAILEYVNEAYAQGRLLPSARAERALARAVSAEMHAGFMALRAQLPMDLRRAPGPLGPAHAPDAAAQDDIRRILELWEDCLAKADAASAPYLFGAWSMADCMFLPVATRFRTYQVPLEAHPRCRAYVDALLAHPRFREWEAAAATESEVLPAIDEQTSTDF
ncbi:MAG: glutathione S-transferase family protein [Candidatus Lambdaproteobacteria bacterium]|nr:glutathione S-transferase family protein [Candidatus Lambdaproteobacteria bacterium]